MEIERQMSKILILCGEVKYSLGDFTAIVTWCPIRHELLKEKGISNYLFGDFSPGEERGQKLDFQLQERLDFGLHKESENNPALKWAPLAIQQIKWRLSRYLWLKECARAIIERFQPNIIIVSSDEDPDITKAFGVMGRMLNIQVEVQHGLHDKSAATIYLSAPYGIPSELDPLWFSFIYWCILKIFHPSLKTYIELYPNLRNINFRNGIHSFNFFRLLSFFWSVAKKITKILYPHTRETLVDSRLEINNPPLVILQKELWKSFSEDEQNLINALLFRFFSHYPHKFLDIVARRLSLFFLITKPSRIILMVDQLDRDRLVAYIAKKHNIQVDYLPHGILYEDYSGQNHYSLFQPDHILVWNEGSRKAFMELNWSAFTTRHPAHQQPIVPVKPLPPDRGSWKVLVLIPDWEGVSLDNREDCTVVGLMTIYRTLTEIGVKGKHIHIKSHFTPIIKLLDRQSSLLIKLRQSLGMEFLIIDPSLKTQQLFPDYNLVILGATTGIFEAARLGIPLVFFGPGLARIGALRGCSLPQAKSKDELKKVLETYNCGAVSKIYSDIVRSLQSGESMV